LTRSEAFDTECNISQFEVKYLLLYLGLLTDLVAMCTVDNYVNIQEGYTHEGSKSIQVVYLKNGSLFTTGFSRMSERQYALWDGVSYYLSHCYSVAWDRL